MSKQRKTPPTNGAPNGNGGGTHSGSGLNEAERQTIAELNAAIAQREAALADVVAQMAALEVSRNQLLAERAQLLAARVAEVKVMARVRGADPEKSELHLDFQSMTLTCRS